MVVSNAPTRCMDVEGIANVVNYNIPIYVATLALGSRPKRGLARLRAKKEAKGVTPHAPRSIAKCEGMNPHTPKGVSTFEVRVLMDF